MNGATQYTGSPNVVNQILLASGTVTASGTGAAVASLGEWSSIIWQLDVTAAAAAVGDTLDVYIQTTIDGTNWLDFVHFTQVLGNGGAKRYITKTIASNTQTEYSTATALGAAAVRHLFGDQYRVNYTVVDGGAHGQSFTFSVTANLK
jgi:hypothetical protein